MNDCANLKAIGGVRCSEEIYNSHERGRGSTAAAAAVASEVEERERELRCARTLQLRLLQLSSGSTVLLWCNNEQRERERKKNGKTGNRVTMPLEIKRNDCCKRYKMRMITCSN